MERRGHRSKQTRVEGPCTYCGQAAEVWDHVIPYSIGGRTWMVESCDECNHVAYNRSFVSIDEKRGWIKARLERKHRSVLDYDLPSETREMLEREILLDRLRWEA